jgi:hypothetical protein
MPPSPDSPPDVAVAFVCSYSLSFRTAAEESAVAFASYICMFFRMENETISDPISQEQSADSTRSHLASPTAHR